MLIKHLAWLQLSLTSMWPSDPGVLFLLNRLASSQESLERESIWVSVPLYHALGKILKQAVYKLIIKARSCWPPQTNKQVFRESCSTLTARPRWLLQVEETDAPSAKDVVWKIISLSAGYIIPASTAGTSCTVPSTNVCKIGSHFPSSNLILTCYVSDYDTSITSVTALEDWENHAEDPSSITRSYE